MPVVDLVVPGSCWANGTGEAPFGLSEGIREQIAVLAAQRFCHHCGLSVGPYERHDAKNPCGRCGERDPGVVRLARAGTFDEPLVTLVHRLKFGRSWEVARIVAPYIYQAITQVSEAAGCRVDLLIPVPLHWRRQARRGFNQAEELARETAALSGWTWRHVLRRDRATTEQTRTESVAQRAENLRGAFSCRRDAAKHVAGKHVWLIDDVTTTGATLHAAANALRKLPRDQRPASISAAVLCVTDNRGPPAVIAPIGQ
jgi:ComF family protein